MKYILDEACNLIQKQTAVYSLLLFKFASVGGLVLIMFVLGCSKNDLQLHKHKLPISGSYRGVDVLDNEGVAWISGSKGNVLKINSAGEVLQQTVIDSSLDFRCIVGISAKEALVASAGVPAKIFRTQNGGDHWQLVFEDTSALAFFDAMNIDTNGLGYVLGDPQKGKFKLYETVDFGKTWKHLDSENLPEANEGEVVFAASNSSMIQVKEGLIFVTGGSNGSYIHAGVPSQEAWKKELLPLNTGASCGGFALKRNLDDLILGGGCYDKIHESKQNFLISDNMGTQWFSLPKGPNGYISGLSFFKKHLITVGDVGLQAATQRTRDFSYLENSIKFNAIDCNETFCVAVGKGGEIVIIN